MDWRERITIEAGKRRRQPCIRGSRLGVYDILEYLAGDMTETEVLQDFPELGPDDIRACFAYAAEAGHRTVHPSA